MEQEQQSSTLVYEYLLNRIRFGYYTYGDGFPSADTFCREFSVSDHTMWTALRRLRAEGYLDMRNGRTTMVIFQQSDQERTAFVYEYFSKRWDAYTDLYKATELIYIPLLVEGFRRMGAEDRSFLSRLAERSGADDIIRFYCYTLQKMENPLAMNLFWEMSLFLGFPFARPALRPVHFDAAAGRRRLNRLLAHVAAEDWSALRKTLVQDLRSDIQQISRDL